MPLFSVLLGLFRIWQIFAIDRTYVLLYNKNCRTDVLFLCAYPGAWILKGR